MILSKFVHCSQPGSVAIWERHHKKGKISPTSNLYYIRRPSEVNKGVVNDMHHPSAHGAPENKNNKITSNKILKENLRERDLIEGAEIEEELKDYLKDRIEEFEKKGIDLQTVINWIETNKEFYSFSEYAFMPRKFIDVEKNP